MLKRKIQRLGLGAMFVVAQLGIGTPAACSNLDLIGNPLSFTNPCFILNCDPNAYRNLNFLLNSDVGPSDFCSVPFLCGDQPQVLLPIDDPSDPDA